MDASSAAWLIPFAGVGSAFQLQQGRRFRSHHGRRWPRSNGFLVVRLASNFGGEGVKGRGNAGFVGAALVVAAGACGLQRLLRSIGLFNRPRATRNVPLDCSTFNRLGQYQVCADPERFGDARLAFNHGNRKATYDGPELRELLNNKAAFARFASYHHPRQMLCGKPCSQRERFVGRSTLNSSSLRT